MPDNGTHPPLVPVDPWVRVTQHGASLNVESNLQGPQVWPVIRQLLMQAADLALLEHVKAEVQGGPRQIVVPTLAMH